MNRGFVVALALGAALPLSACSDTNSVGDAGTLSLMLTDAPGDFTQAQVTIERIELVGDGQPYMLREEPFTTDLLTLSNDVASLVEDYTVPAGTYTEVRFIIPGACVGVEQDDGSQLVYASSGFDACGAANGSLTLPSFAQTGIKVKLPGGAIEVAGDAHILLLDFDVSQSFGQEAGLSGSWVMNPVVLASDISLTGSLVIDLSVADGVDMSVVNSSLADFQATLSTEAVPQGFSDPDGDGVFTATFMYLLPDVTYDVSVGLVDGVSYGFSLSPADSQSALLGSGEQATVSFELMSVTASQ